MFTKILSMRLHKLVLFWLFGIFGVVHGQIFHFYNVRVMAAPLASMLLSPKDLKTLKQKNFMYTFRNSDISKYL